MEEKSPELRATLDLIMNYMKGIEMQIKILAKEGYIIESHEKTLVLALYNFGDMITISAEHGITMKALIELKGEKHDGKEKSESK